MSVVKRKGLVRFAGLRVQVPLAPDLNLRMNESMCK
jgi:hypothetical protein